MGVFHIVGHGDFQWERDKVSLSEAVAMEQATGKLFDELVMLYNAKRRLGAAAFAWLAMRRNGKRIGFPEFLDSLQVDGIQETFEDETPPVDESAGEESTPADPPASAAAKPAARKSPRASARGKAASSRK